jgi:hypothetical protein
VPSGKEPRIMRKKIPSRASGSEPAMRLHNEAFRVNALPQSGRRSVAVWSGAISSADAKPCSNQECLAGMRRGPEPLQHFVHYP